MSWRPSTLRVGQVVVTGAAAITALNLWDSFVGAPQEPAMSALVGAVHMASLVVDVFSWTTFANIAAQRRAQAAGPPLVAYADPDGPVGVVPITHYGVDVYGYPAWWAVHLGPMPPSFVVSGETRGAVVYVFVQSRDMVLRLKSGRMTAVGRHADA